MTMSRIEGEWGELRCDDGDSRPFGGTSHRHLIAEELARYDGWAEIRPGQWALAGRVERRLRAAGLLARKPRDARSKAPA